MDVVARTQRHQPDDPRPDRAPVEQEEERAEQRDEGAGDHVADGRGRAERTGDDRVLVL